MNKIGMIGRKIVWGLVMTAVLGAVVFWGGGETARAEERGTGGERLADELIPTATASEGGEMTGGLTPTAVVKVNITEPRSPESLDRLESVLERQKVGGWNGWNSMKKMVRLAVERGVSANTVVIMLLLPLVATLVAVLHYVLGLTGYGIFVPTMIAVTFLATGIPGGLALFALILVISLISGSMLKKLKLHFWPTRSINLLFISLGTFGLMVGSSFFEVFDVSGISIFPILFMIILAEDFVRTQLLKSREEAKRLTLGTLILAMAGAGTMNVRWIQEKVLLNPEAVVMLVLAVNLLVGNYSGIRWLEIKRFRKAIREKSK